MRKKHLILGILILGASLAALHFGCIKGNPVGADVSTLANTTITVLVFDGTTAQNGVTIQATDPSGNTTTQVTGANGQTAFPAKLAGQWTLTVPTQGNFYLSTANVNVAAGTVGPSVSFTAQGQQLILAPVTPETYGISGANISYTITYSDSGNLAEPVSLFMTGPITQTGWTYNFNYPVLGSTNNTSQLNIVVPQGSYQQPTFTIQALRMNGTLLTSSATRAINRNYSIQTNFYLDTIANGSAQFSNVCSPSISPTTMIGNVSLSTVNAGDNTTAWVASLNISGLNVNSGVITNGSCCNLQSPAFNGQFITNDGSFSSGQTDSFQLLPGQLKQVTIVAPYCSFGGGFYCGTTLSMPTQNIIINFSLTSGVGTAQGAATMTACGTTVGTVLTLTR